MIQLSDTMAVVVILLILLALLAALLITPFDFILNSYRHQYVLRWGWLGMARIDPLGPSPSVRLRLGPVRWRWTLGDLAEMAGRASKRRRKKPKPEPKAPKKAQQAKGPSKALVLRLARTFRIKACFIELDTDNYLLNAWLAPVVWGIPGLSRYLQLNFMGRNEIDLHVRNRLWNLGLAFLRTKK